MKKIVYLHLLILSTLTTIYTRPMYRKQKLQKADSTLSNTLLIKGITNIQKRKRCKYSIPPLNIKRERDDNKKKTKSKAISYSKNKKEEFRETRRHAISLKINTRAPKKNFRTCKTDSITPTTLEIILPKLHSLDKMPCPKIKHKSPTQKLLFDHSIENNDPLELPPLHGKFLRELNNLYKSPSSCRKKKKNHFRNIPKLSKAFSTKSLLYQIEQRQRLKQLKKTSGIDYKIYKGTKNKKIYGIKGAVLLYDLRSFTYFCNETKNIVIPTNFMADLSQDLDELVYQWDGEIISRTGDGFVAIFPKTTYESNYKKSLNRAYKCSIALGYVTDEFLSKKNLESTPKKFGIGIEIGTTLIFKNKRFSKLTPISSVARSINNAQRYEQHSKQLLVKWKDYKPITIPEKLYETLPKKIQKTFKTKKWYLKENKDFYKQQLNQTGFKEIMFVCSAPFALIKLFYEHNPKIFSKRKRKLTSRLHEVLNL